MLGPSFSPSMTSTPGPTTSHRRRARDEKRDALGGCAAEGNITCGGGDGKRLVVIAVEKPQFRSGTNAAGFEEFEQAAVALINAAYRVNGSRCGIRQQQQAAVAAT